MTDITFECPKCRNYIVADDRIVGREANCPHCKSAIFIHDASTALMADRRLCVACKADIPHKSHFCPICGVSQKAIPAAAETAHRTCTTCGARIDIDAVVCPKCKARKPVKTKSDGSRSPPHNNASGMGF